MKDNYEKSAPNHVGALTPTHTEPARSSLTRDEYRATAQHYGLGPMHALDGALDDDELRATRNMMGERPTDVIAAGHHQGMLQQQQRIRE